MGRLIDADDFEEFIKRKYKDGESTDDIKDQMLFDLSYQPTAYSVGKVVEELEKEKEIHTEHYNISLYKDYPEVKQRYEQIQLVIDDAIAKVKKGGVE